MRRCGIGIGSLGNRRPFGYVTANPYPGDKWHLDEVLLTILPGNYFKAHEFDNAHAVLEAGVI